MNIKAIMRIVELLWKELKLTEMPKFILVIATQLVCLGVFDY
jgi:hypothetical protein